MQSYYGEQTCEEIVKSSKKNCNNSAYFYSNGKLLCGVHSKKDSNREKLPINPDKKSNDEQEMQNRKLEIDEQAKQNREEEKKGNVKVSKLRMMKSPEYFKGYLNVFPNYKHENRKDGFGCKSLSPKSMGPVGHQMPNLPPAKNIENYHQFAKFWKFEMDKNGNILPQYLQARIDAYNSTTPFRHKHERQTLLKYNNNVNIPEFSMYYDKDGKEHRYNYLDCRYFYCHFYEILAKEDSNFLKLKEMINNGYNLNIVGYDGFNVEKSTLEHYYDTSRPFGHELVLYTLLVEEDSSKYPWNIYYEKNVEKYENVI